ncbi:MAG: AAA family ATPase, partial [Desulfobacula sp.]|nr:AAA family ATPase [Desulfobacula sp.]
GVELFGEKIYSSLATSLTYGKLLCLAQAELETGTSVILDATYSRAKYRREVINLAKDKGIKPIFIECSAKEKIMRERLLERKYRPSVSDARIDHFEELDARYERFRYAGNALHIRVNTALPLEDVMRKILIRAFQLDSNPLINIPQTELTMV